LCATILRESNGSEIGATADPAEGFHPEGFVTGHDFSHAEERNEN
jgi:hypothetical protein